MVQDYEPSFHPWSSAYLIAQSAYNSSWPKKIIFNSSELAEYYSSQGHIFQNSVTFEPVLHHRLRAALSSRPQLTKERRILFYGRPEVRRNCFYLGRKALEIWALEYGLASQWSVISVGSQYRAFDLVKGKKVRVLGKLSLDGYVVELQKAAVGLSLMSSPHPSYPPIEIAHFGALTVSNSFPSKDITSWHENIVDCKPNSPEAIAERLIDCCDRFEADRLVGSSGTTLKPDYIDDFSKEKLKHIVEMILN